MRIRMTLTACLVSAWFTSAALAEMSDIERNTIIRRACEAAIWGMPAVSVYDIELALQRDAGAEPGTVGYMTSPMDSRHGFLTANDVTPYVFTGLTTANGPIVIEVPPAEEKAVFFGTIVNAWQVPIVDVGPTGQDAGRGGRYLILLPDHEGPVPGGYLVHQANTYGIHFAFRPVARNDGGHTDQAAYARKLRWYPLSKAANPPLTRFIDIKENPVNTLPVYDMTFFTDLDTVVQREPVLPRDKVMMAMLASIGIERGRPFEPDEEMEAALLEGLSCAYDTMQEHFVTRSVVPLWEDRQ